MPVDLPRLFLGTLAYDEAVAPLDDARFSRIANGFAGNYVVVPQSDNAFRFERGEGFDRFERFDAFAYVDGGTVVRSRASMLPDVEMTPGVAILAPEVSTIRFSLNVRVILIFWAAALLVARWFVGGDWLFWEIGFLVLYGAHVALIRASLRRKLKTWLARESWN